MRSSLASKFVTTLLVCSLEVCSPAFAQQQPPEETRPRRTQTQSKSPEPAQGVPNATDALKPSAEAWKVSQPSIVDVDAPTGRAVSPEPTIRVALATDVRSASISTNAHLMSATDLAQTFVPLDVARVRVDSHLLAPLPQTSDGENFRLKVDGLESRATADEQAKQIRDAVSEESQAVFDAETKTWGLLVGPRRSREAAESAQLRLEAAGFDSNILDLSHGATTVASTNAPVRTALVSRWYQLNRTVVFKGPESDRSAEDPGSWFFIRGKSIHLERCSADFASEPADSRVDHFRAKRRPAVQLKRTGHVCVGQRKQRSGAIQ